MQLIGTDFTFDNLNIFIEHLEKLAENNHLTAKKLYPSDDYKIADGNTSRCLRSLYHLRNLRSFWQVEIGKTALDFELEYLNLRITQLKEFYLQANEIDLEQLSTSIKDLQIKILDKTKERQKITAKLHRIELPNEVAETLQFFGLLPQKVLSDTF
jgi:hypothetical protein